MIDIQDLTEDFLDAIIGLDHCWGSQFSEVKFVVKNVPLSDMKNIGADKRTITLKYNDISFIAFKLPQESLDALSNADRIDIIGKVTLNTWNGITTKQIIIEDFEIAEPLSIDNTKKKYDSVYKALWG